MTSILRVLACAVLLPVTLPWSAEQATQTAVTSAVELQRADLVRLSDEVWGFAEIGFRETKSADVLMAYAQRHGLTVERGVAGMPTAFVASYGSGQARHRDPWRIRRLAGHFAEGDSDRASRCTSAPRDMAAATTSSARPASARPSPSRR